MKKRGSYFYTEYKGIKLRASQEYQMIYLMNLFKLTEKRNLPIIPRYVKKIHIVRIPDKSIAYFYHKEKLMLLNSSQLLFPPKTKIKSRLYLEKCLSTLIHELIHAYDKKNRITDIFFEEYKEAVALANEYIDPNLFILPSKTVLYNEGIADFLNDRKLILKYKSKYTKFVKKNIGIPTVYALSSPHEFTAEIMAMYLTRSSSIKNPKYLKLINKALQLIQN
jgi:hypothetical protein